MDTCSDIIMCVIYQNVNQMQPGDTARHHSRNGRPGAAEDDAYRRGTPIRAAAV